MYHYQAKIIRLIDGDTCRAELQLGFGVAITLTARLAKIDTAEMRGASRKAGIAAKEALAELCERYVPICIRTLKDRTGKYGRYLAVLEGVDADGGVVDLNQRLIDDGFARPYG